MPAISVIVPCYNAEKYIDQCFDSILAQTFADFEVIAVNDGSTDGTLAKLREFAQRDQHIKVIDQPNGGASAARNTGLVAAAGEYIAFVDSDDYADPALLQTLHDGMLRTGADFVRCGYVNVGQNGTETPFAQESAEQLLGKTELKNRCVKPLLGPSSDMVSAVQGEQTEPIPIHTLCAALYKASIIRKTGLRFDESLPASEDAMFNLAFALHADSLLFVPQNLYYYVHHHGSLWQGIPRDSVRFMRNRQRLWQAKKELCNHYGLGDDFRSCYRRSVVLATVQTALIMTNQNGPRFWVGRTEIKAMLRLPIVREAFKTTPLKGLPLIYKLPLWLSKCKLAFLLWLCCKTVNLAGKSPYQ